MCVLEGAVSCRVGPATLLRLLRVDEPLNSVVRWGTPATVLRPLLLRMLLSFRDRLGGFTEAGNSKRLFAAPKRLSASALLLSLLPSSKRQLMFSSWVWPEVLGK